MTPTSMRYDGFSFYSGIQRLFLDSFRCLAACAIATSFCLAQAPRPTNPGGGNAGGGVVIGGGGIGTLPGGGGITTLPGGGGIITIPGGGGGGGGGAVSPSIVAPRGVIVGDVATATASLTGVNGGGLTAGQILNAAANATYQWAISGGRFTSGSRASSVQFVADAAGTVSLSLTIAANGTSFNPTAQIAAVSADSAGAITAPSTVATTAANFVASVPQAQNGDRTFRWTVSGDAAIASGQGTASATLRPGSPGLKEIICSVNLQNLVTVRVRAYIVVTGGGAPVSVTVNNGSGGGTFSAGSRVDIFANAPGPGQVFDRWTGDISLLGAGALAAAQSRAVITVPASPVSLTATYRDIGAWTPTTVADFNPQSQVNAANQTTTFATTLTYYVPKNAEGLVFLLHDSGGSPSDWFERPEQMLLVRDLVGAGYGVAALASVNRTARTWATQTALANNLDARNHVAALDAVMRAAAIAGPKPVFFVGIGEGAGVAVRYADQLATATPARLVKGVVLYLSAGSEALAVTSRVPQMYALAINDDSLGAAGLTEARQNSQLLVGRGIGTAVVNNGVAPVYPGRFRTLGITAPTFTANDAQTVLDAVKKTGALDANSYVKTIPTTAALTAALPPTLQPRAADVAAQLGIAAATREFFSDANARVINFFNNRADDAPTPPPGRMVNLSSRGQIAYLGDTFSLGFTLSGTQRATLLIRGVGPGLAKFNVGSGLAAPKLEVVQGARVFATNEGWDRAANATQVADAASANGAFALDRGSLDTAALVTLDPGTYVAAISSLGGTIGEVLAEIYDVSRNGTRLTNLSILGRVLNAGDVIIPGIAIAGNNPRTLVIRAIGPGLANVDVNVSADSVLEDPRILVLNAAGQTVANNNNWSQGGAAGAGGTLTAAFPAVGAFPLQNASGDAALIEALPPGNYTLQAGAAPGINVALDANGEIVEAATRQVGLVLVEIYEVR